MLTVRRWLRLHYRITLNPVKFTTSLKENYHNEALLPIAALICIDGIIPLGSNFVTKIRENSESNSNLRQDPAFNTVSDLIPAEDTQGFVNKTFDVVGDWMDNVINSFGLTRESLLNNFGGFMEIADDKLDYLAAFLDASTNVFEHTGIQTVARKLIKQAYEELS